MSVDPFVLIPLYIYPETPSLWQPLFKAAETYTGVNFTAVINPWDGPGESDCPDASYAAAMQEVKNYPNIKTLGYVHTADEWNCGEGGGPGICFTTADLATLNGNVTKYSKWGTSECPPGPAVDGIFFDESPYDNDPNHIEYMDAAAQHARSKMTGGENTIMFNAGTNVQDPAYWALADWICALENPYDEFDGMKTWEEDGEEKTKTTKQLLDERTSGGEFVGQATVILTSYPSGQDVTQDVEEILAAGVAGLSITDFDGYHEWGQNFKSFAEAVNTYLNGP